MIKQKQDEFYAKVGRALQSARQRRNISVAQLSSISGEHHKTIRGIEAGKPHSLHHSVWMKNILGLDINTIITNMDGGERGKQQEEISSGNNRSEGKVSFKDFI